MAAGPSPLSPPPGNGPPPDQQSPTSPTAASPAPPTPAPATQQGTQMLIQVVHGLRAIAKAFPAAAPEISQINDLMRSVGAKLMQSQPPAEPAAPPMSG